MKTTNFSHRHIGPTDQEIQLMLGSLNVSSTRELVEKAAPKAILSTSPMNLPKALTEVEFIQKAKSIARKNKVFKSYIGQGYYDCYTPAVIQRNILENPGWYTAYTPYQAEISQGRMEALLNFQTMITELTGMNISNASLLDEGTAAAEAMVMALNLQLRKTKSRTFFVDENVFAQTKEILQTRAKPLGIELLFGNATDFDFSTEVFAAYLQYPNAKGTIENYTAFATTAHENNALVIAASDLLSLCLITPPAEWGADIVVGSSQRFGVPMGFGGPHAAFLATKDQYKRNIPGRIIGVSKDSRGKQALRLALQTREQHIRREKATSNICTAQVLLAVMASMYAVFHGPEGLKQIASNVRNLTSRFSNALKQLGYAVTSEQVFDTLFVELDAATVAKIKTRAEQAEVNLCYHIDGGIAVSFDETKTDKDLAELVEVFNLEGKSVDLTATNELNNLFIRKSAPLKHEVFQTHKSETDMLRYINSLERKDISLTSSMIPLGSCTMKLNATSEMLPVTWPEFSSLHPFCPMDQAEGYLQLIKELEDTLAGITGYDGVSLQPNAGSQGEYAGLLVIKKYLEAKGEGHRNICLIPSSAHGTNPASAVMAGMKVVVVKCNGEGDIDIADLNAKAEEHKDNLAALMITYPSTHGVFESEVKNICKVIHDHGGQVYTDGANLNALVGVAKPGEFGSDVSHLNLHKTFCIPHGGGGPGVGPIGVAKHLTPYLPKHSLVAECGPKDGISAVSAAPWGSASILPISWAYCQMMGEDGLTQATEVAILNANYIAKKLENEYPILYRGQNDLVAHECIIDVRPFKVSAGVDVNDIAKRLMDFGFHAPTMSWPVAGTLMIEPTESESKAEIDRFIEAMVTIREEIREIEQDTYPKDNNVLVNAPHTADDLAGAEWERPYDREKAFFPVSWVRANKFFVPVNRVDNAFGDRHLVCTCPSMSDYEESSTDSYSKVAKPTANKDARA